MGFERTFSGTTYVAPQVLVDVNHSTYTFISFRVIPSLHDDYTGMEVMKVSWTEYLCQALSSFVHQEETFGPVVGIQKVCSIIYVPYLSCVPIFHL